MKRPDRKRRGSARGLALPASWSLLAILAGAGLAGCEPAVTPPARDANAAPHRRPPASPVKPFRLGTPDVVLLVTGGTNGVLEVCYCAGSMPGGLTRRSGLVRSYRQAFPRTFLLGTGNALRVEDPRHPRNEYLLRGYRLVGYDALILGAQEWATPLRRLRDILAPGPTCLSSTVQPARRSDLPLATEVRREWPGARLAVLSYVPPAALASLPPERRGALEFASLADVARRVDELKRSGYVVVLSPYAYAGEMEAAVRACDADLFLPSHVQVAYTGVNHVAGKPVVTVGGCGYVGVIAMKVSGGRIEAIEYRLEAVTKRWPADARLLALYKAYTHVAMRYALNAERTSGLAYVPSATCGRCHEKPYRHWRESRHARAYQTLLDARRAGDPDCLVCHTSGFGTRSGFYTLDKTPGLANVNCQDCHRFDMVQHRTKDFQPPRVTAKVCTSCHTEVTDPKFAFRRKERLAAAGCPRRPATRPAHD